MIDPNERQKLYIVFGIFGIAAFIVYINLILKPAFAGFFTMNREFCAIRDRVRNAEVLIANEASILKQYKDLSEQSEIFEKKLPVQGEIEGLLEDFSKVAELSGVKILKIKPLEALDRDSGGGINNALYSEFPILIEAMGGYHQCGVFLNRLESMDRFIKIRKVDIKSRTQDIRHHDIKLELTTYVIQ